MKTQVNLNNIYIKSQPHGLERELGLQKIF